MSKSLTALCAALMAASLAACGGGGGDDSGGGGGGGGGGGDGKTLSEKQIWYGHETAFSAVSLHQAFEPMLENGIVIGRDGTPECLDGGTVSGVWTDADDSGTLSAGDSVALTMNDCRVSDNGIPFTGKATVDFDEVEGDLLEEESDWTLAARVTLGEGASFDGTSASGTASVKASNDVSSAEPKGQRAEFDIPAIVLTEDGGAVTMKFKDYAVAVAYDPTTDADTYSRISFSVSGSDPVLGPDYAYDASMTETVRFSHEAGGFLAGAFATKTAAETITTRFQANGNAPGTVTFSSSLGGSKTMTYGEFDDL
ncbi:hypothetical protein CDO46_04060 [Pigmentiphaga sp. NML030171]|uniref:hypothetical protein n=1 Tax=unclassified Pigmentiphaga TaxID=2626614 RepID=UPI000B411168|nr:MULTISPECIES: hypothetical protein [unclassified Pigmentiphaga]OVZ61184.1 hypothetical protein CDO44_05935 [Pigmentiphaga sp. NML080357]OVZ66050.1 hypothetical protein CDO46_04060 [Pigmentiphaga sp. NML030171]